MKNKHDRRTPSSERDPKLIEKENLYRKIEAMKVARNFPANSKSDTKK